MIGGVDAHCFPSKVFVGNPKPAAFPADGKLALLVTDLRKVTERGQKVPIAQFFNLLPDTLARPTHVFRGLQRPLRTDEDGSADEGMLVYSRKPAFDWIWGGRDEEEGPQRMPAPDSCVFAVTIRPNIRHREKFPDVDGWINHWTWIGEDSVLPEAPLDWADRYAAKHWSNK